MRYLYLLRFSIMLWLFAWVLTVLNGSPWKDSQAAHYPLRQLISGIVTPEYTAQFIAVAFFLVSSGFVALISARVVVINGEERFPSRPSFLLRWLLANDSRSFGWLWESFAVLVSQAPTICVFHYLIANGRYEQVCRSSAGCTPLVGIVCGSLLAIAFWWVINAAFYATYEMPGDVRAEQTVKLGKNAARTILFPRWCFGLTANGDRVRFDNLEGVTSPLAQTSFVPGFAWLGRLLLGAVRCNGYLCPTDDRLYEAHAFSIPAVCGAIFLYITMCPLTAPVPVISWSKAFYIVFMVVPSLFALWVFWWSKSKVDGYGLLKWKAGFTLAIAGFLFAIVYLYELGDPERFPPLALVLIMAIAAFWTLSVLAFAADRFRIPVLTSIIVMMLIPRIAGWAGAKEEHYISTARPQSNKELQSPQMILDNMRARNAGQPNQPLIIVTATGGGLHASVWTASVLGNLEERFNASDASGPATPFHEHLLLASTVSGGSVGLLTYLDQLQTLQKGQGLDQTRIRRMVDASQCSSLEAVSWGLVYFDLPKAFLPVIPYWIKPSTGLPDGDENDLDKSPLLKDRTWALRKGFARNLHNLYCVESAGSPYPDPRDDSKHSNLAADTAMSASILADERTLTLATLLRAGIDPRIPAFTMNTTTVEGGDRFLLANYQVPRNSVTGTNESYPAESFLYKYRTSSNSNMSVDLPLATAAQLSATFPYVSSAARVPQAVDPKGGLHYVDGGYYDNDGTASAIEFLRSALQNPTRPEPVLRIILVEIRNSPNPESDLPSESANPWNVLGQLVAPLSTFWSAGHESVTERNRVGLDLFEKAYADKVRIERIVFADSRATDRVSTDPLNWSLTPRQRDEAQESAARLTTKYEAVRNWFFNFDKMWSAEHSKTKGTAGPPP